MPLKFLLKGQKDVKSGPRKREGKGVLFNAPGGLQESANVTKMNTFEGVLDGTIGGASENTPRSATKGELRDLRKDPQKGVFEVTQK